METAFYKGCYVTMNFFFSSCCSYFSYP